MGENNGMQSTHWADIYADKIIREKGDKDLYTCASGITPSGTVHIGNFREMISTELVVRALRDKGKNVRFIYSWDEYDVFRKVPKNMPQPELLEKYLRCPITMVPDTSGAGCESYARKNEVDVEKILPAVGITPEYLYQAARYRASMYAEGMRHALEHKKEIIDILNEYRTEPLTDEWWPISVFSSFTNKDTTTILSWDGEWGITYRDDELGKTETIDLRTTPYAKLHWRVDWPMRWALEHVDFEPAGKDHHSQGGSFDTSKKIVELFGWHAPVSFQYDFISIKGRGGKISSSSGEVISLYDVLEVYTPEVCRYLFAGTRPNTEFAISFDLDVLKIYEDYDNCERIAFGLMPVNEKRLEKEKRIYEFSQVGEMPKEPGYQVPFRHLCNLLQINSGDIDAVIASLPGITPGQEERMRVRLKCAWAWITQFAPEDFRWHLLLDEPAATLEKPEYAKCLKDLCSLCDNLDELDDKAFAEKMYDVFAANSLESTEMFPVLYNVLIGKERGPKIAGFIKTIGREKAQRILSKY